MGLNQWLNQVHLPIVHSEASYHAPLFLGDPLCITLGTSKIGPHSFRLNYQFKAWQNQKWVPVADVHTTHVAVHNKKARPLPNHLTTLLTQLGEAHDQYELDPFVFKSS